MQNVQTIKTEPPAVASRGFRGKDTGDDAPMLATLYVPYCKKCNIPIIESAPPRLTGNTTAGRKLAQTQNDLGLNRPPLTAKKRGQSRKVDTKGTRPSARMAMVLQIRSWREQAKQRCGT